MPKSWRTDKDREPAQQWKRKSISAEISANRELKCCEVRWGTRN